MTVPSRVRPLDLHNGGHRFTPFLVDAVAAVVARAGLPPAQSLTGREDVELSSTDFLYDTKGMDR
ncbi:hypothetical protein [Streptomyces sp. ISL-86]|uniref:hypothetical protein n=1 Tax=Streptomyces sp. ISL-86 TaxID=2819187 RepID=UPI001BEC7B12|nr:hypothetical protein [Streptomyces sp. ISL-86]MBT2453710.1 hypothetical protein [Streptomyces sp. ISL-86]